jgi:septation ring formation regulator EzrA
MDEKLLALTTKFNDLQTKFNDLKSANLELQSKALDDKVKLDSYADLETQVTAANEKVESLTATYSDQIKSLGEKVEALAAPFDVDYKAPEDMDQLLKDLDTYMEKAKALPSGRQTQDTEDDVVYSMPESAYQV